jgi:hypothetical protein
MTARVSRPAVGSLATSKIFFLQRRDYSEWVVGGSHGVVSSEVYVGSELAHIQEGVISCTVEDENTSKRNH